MRRAWQLASVAFLALAAGVLVLALQFPLEDELGPGPGFFPFWLAVLMGALALLLLIEVSRDPEPPGTAPVLPARAGAARVGRVLLGLGGTALLLGPLGFRPTVLLFTAYLLDAAKKSPNTIRTATTGILSDDHLAILMVEEAVPGAVFRIVHTNGAAEQIKGILGGHIDVAFDNVGSITKRAKAGEVRVLAVLDTQRSKFLPDVPTTVELGLTGVVSSSTRGIAGPRGMPEAVVKKLQDVFRSAMEHPEHVKKMEEAGLGIRVMVGEEYAKYYRETHERARKYTEWARSRPHR